jgi:hypothetical protein
MPVVTNAGPEWDTIIEFDFYSWTEDRLAEFRWDEDDEDSDFLIPGVLVNSFATPEILAPRKIAAEVRRIARAYRRALRLGGGRGKALTEQARAFEGPLFRRWGVAGP